MKNADDPKLDRTFPPDQPLGTRPDDGSLLAVAHVRAIAGLAGLPAATADAVAKAAPAPGAIGQARLAELVSRKVLTDVQAQQLGLASAIYQISDNDPSLASAIRTSVFPQLGHKPPASTADLARLGPADWSAFLASSKVPLPAGTTPERTGAALAARFAALHPNAALAGRLPDVTSLSAAQVAEIQKEPARIQQIDRAYPGLGLATVLGDPTLDPKAKTETVARRAGLVRQALANLGETPVLRLDLGTDGTGLALGKLNATADEERMIVSALQAYQRAFRLTRDVDDLHALLGAGFASAVSVARIPFAAFHAQSGFEPARAKAIWDEARTSLADVAQVAAAVVDARNGLFGRLPVGNQPPSAAEYLAGLPGLSDLFGGLSFCACDECRSVLGPAAYFVDLMKFIDENLRPAFAGKPDHPLDLRTRRPDLWTLPLSCENTKERVPTLDLVDEILENDVARRNGYAGAITDRTAVGALVYEQVLARREDSFRQPFILPLARTGAYLAALGVTRAEVAAALGATGAAFVRTVLGMSDREIALVTRPDTDLANLRRLYGLALGDGSRTDAADLGPAMDLSRAALGQLAASRFVAAGGARVTITAGKRDGASVQNDVEWVSGLDADALDRMHRFTRLARKVGWAIPDLDRVLTALADTTLGSLDAIAQLRALQVRLGLGIEELCARVGAPPEPQPVEPDRAARLAATLGVDGSTLAALASDDPAALSAAADALHAALAARSADAAARAATLDEAERPVREARRDALADHLIRSVTDAGGRPLWRTLDDVYQYFLIDVASGGCATTSRVVAATTTAQLYVHRAIMNLERSASGDVALSMPAEALAEWAWRRTYRVWQANRKVFLWPENYLDPDLRDDKTPLFADLQRELLQTDIDDQSVLDAYAKYLAGFEELASLTIAGAYHDQQAGGAGGAARDVLHLFGVSASDPPTYHYRTCQDLLASARDPSTAAVWSPWQKITVQITGRKVSPVVHKGRLHVFWIDIRTQPVNRVADGASTFVGYKHKMSLKLTTLRPDGTWTAPQEILLPAGGLFGASAGQVDDPLVDRSPLQPHVARLDPQRRFQSAAIDDYTLSGPNWDWGWLDPLPSGPRICFRDFDAVADVDLFRRRAIAIDMPALPPPYPQLLCAKSDGPDGMTLYYGTPPAMTGTVSGYANAVVDARRLDQNDLDLGRRDALRAGLYVEPIAAIPATTELLAVPGSEADALLQIGNDVLLVQGSALDDAGYVVRRIGTTLVEDIARRLFEGGLDGVLDTQTQYALQEAGLPITPAGTLASATPFRDFVTPTGTHVVDRSRAGQLDFAGPYGVYLREIFCHVPYLIADALTSRGRFEAAQRWYHYLFDPTSPEAIDVTGLPPDQAARRLLDRVWRYREFRDQDAARLRDLLTDPAALAASKADPFNPWAIARHRVSAQQKAVVMRYVGNLLDWADSLFSQFTMESVNEAMMLYVMAADILGPRPAELGDCGAGEAPITYGGIASHLDAPGDVLVELETWALGARAAREAGATGAAGAPRYAIEHSALFQAVTRNPLLGLSARAAATADAPAAGGEAGMFRGLGWNATRTTSWGPALGNATVKTADKLGGRSFGHAGKADLPDRAGRFGWSVVRQFVPAFCVPANADLLACWDRVEDRLYKLRHCLDIDGRPHDLALLAPPLDPAQIAALQAEGLGLDDVLGAGHGDLPPYRFLYLVERAKAFAAGLSGFGAALLSALEKKDAEQLNRLRLTQQMNLAQLTTQVRQLEIDAAAEALATVTQQLASAQYRSAFYAGLLDEDRNGWEIAESAARHTLSAIHTSEATLEFVAAVLHLIPQAGSPFAMKYGGVELGSSMGRFAFATGHLGAVAEAVASSASLEASFARRSEGWRHQKALADHDVQSLTRQQRAAQIRLDIANRSLDLHRKSLDQIQETLDLTDGKFTSLGLYTWLARTLQGLYRSAYQNALALAKLAEQAFRFERGDAAAPGLAASYWEPTRAGLLAGERLLLDLQTLERRFLETNDRTLEVDQTFALSQIAPGALLDLRETGESTFTVGEAFFDLFYPGHYKRRIKAVRLTIPCITGPYVNVSATLDLLESKIRATPTAALVAVPPTRSVSIATSTAQGDAGAFELSFRDERYLPFEGLGAVESRWHLALPKAFRQFDYQTINDVILSISYTAEQDGDLRERVERQSAALEESLLGHFTRHPAQRLFSLRQDFSSAFTRLLRSPPGTPVKIALTDRNFPLFFRSRSLRVTRAVALIRTAFDPTALPAALAGFSLTIDGVALGPAPNPFTLPTTTDPGPPFGGLPFSDKLPIGADPRGPDRAGQEHVMTIDAGGGFAPTSPQPGDASAIDASKLLDVLLYLEYALT